MVSQSFENALAGKGCLLMDGATGTNLFDMGLVSGDAPELWNDEYPDRVLTLNSGFVAAGSDVILTNTFGANAMRLKLHGSAHRVAELNEKAAKIACTAANQADRDVYVAGSMGPLGELIEPVGALEQEVAVQAFVDQAQALERGGCHLLWIETISSREELVAAATGAMSTNLPFVVCGSFDTNGRTMMGISPAEFVEICLEMDVQPIAVGSNCGVGPAQTVAATLEMSNAYPNMFHYVAKANCGIPVWEGTQIRYTATPEQMFVYAQIARSTGATIIGGCCGTKYEHVQEMRSGLDRYRPLKKPTMTDIEEKLGEVFDTTPVKSTRKRRARRRS